jgi:hypothetical protein
MKLSLDALKERAGATASMDLLATISGGEENACHDTPRHPLNQQYDDIPTTRNPYNHTGQMLMDWLYGLTH